MSDDLPTLFSSPNSCALAVDIALRWAGADYDLQVLHVGQDLEPAFLAMNPSGRVPALKLKGQTVLTGAHALLLLVADSHPERDLAPSSSSPIDRYRLEQLLTFMTCDVHEALAPFLSANRNRSVRPEAAEITRGTLDVASRLLVQLDDRMGARAFILGKRTIADSFLYVLTRWAEAVGRHPTATSNLLRFRAEMEADPAVAASLADHGMTPASKA